MIDDIAIKDGNILELRRDTPEEIRTVAATLNALIQKAAQEGWPTKRFTISVEGTMLTITGKVGDAIGCFNDPKVLTPERALTLIRVIRKILDRDKRSQKVAPHAGMLANRQLGKSSKQPKQVPLSNELKEAYAEMLRLREQCPIKTTNSFIK